MAIDINDLISRARSGDTEAQRELAFRLHEGDGIQRDAAAAEMWLKKAAEAGDAVAQTTYAILLRSTKEPESERESVRWLTLAAEQGDERARTNLGRLICPTPPCARPSTSFLPRRSLTRNGRAVFSIARGIS
jgi:TPR repeat protein